MTVCKETVPDGGLFSSRHTCGKTLHTPIGYARHLEKQHGYTRNEARRMAGLSHTVPVRFGCELGAMAPPLRQQFAGLQTPRKPCISEVLKLQHHADAITRLHLHQVLTDAEVHRARKRLMKKIQQAHGL